MNALWLDLRWSVRSFRKRPAAALAVVSILASAIAVATVLGSFFAVVIYNFPPVKSPETVIRVWRADDTRPAGHREPSSADFVAWKDDVRTLTSLTAWTGREAIVGGADGQTLETLRVSGDYFALAGVAPRIGRAFVADDFERPDSAIISDRIWRERFHADPSVIGQRLAVDVEPREIVGVMPAGFWLPTAGVDVWLPLVFDPRLPVPIDIAGRLVAGKSVVDAQAEFDVLIQRGAGAAATARTSRSLLRSIPQENKIRIVPASEVLVAPALAILLIACANVGNMMIIRTLARQRELAIRSALGATPAQLARLSAAEATVFGLAGVAAGAMLAAWGMMLFRLEMESRAPALAGSIHVGYAAVAVTAIASLMALFATALAPAVSVWRRNLAPIVAGGFRRLLVPRFGYGIGDVLVVLQVGLAVVLVVVCALFIRAFAELERMLRPAVDVSVQVARLVTPADLAASARADIYARVVDEIARRGDVKTVALATALPGGETSASMQTASPNGSTECRAAVALVTPTYFDALGLPLERGASFSASGGPAIVVSARGARKCWSDAAGEEWRARIPSSPVADWLPVIGVAADPFRPASALGTQDEKVVDRPVAWIVGARDWPQSVYVLVKPHAAPLPIASLSSAVAHASPNIAMEPATTLAQTYDVRFSGPNTVVAVIGAITVLALLMAFAGVYAALSQSCTLRLTELGIRMALGADPRRLAAVAIARDLPLVVTGVVGGIVGTLWVTSITWRDLLRIAALDARVWLAVVAVLGAAALLASIGPVLRAVRVDPIAVLRAD